MTEHAYPSIEFAEIVLPCTELSETLSFFTDLGFLVQRIAPADQPRLAVVSGFGVRLCLDTDAVGDAGCLRLASNIDRVRTEIAPNGTKLVWSPAMSPVDLPPATQSFVHTALADSSSWAEGRAGMRYRDLIPNRQSGRFIASHIQIPDGGPVPDYVHFHRIRFQFIYCWKGWVKVVYEDQGEPFVLRAGDLVLQPPQIRHRVLESSPGLEVIEVGCPAEHETWADNALALPTATAHPHRSFAGQRFVLFQTDRATWTPWRQPGFETADTGIGAATNHLVDVAVVRAAAPPAGAIESQRGDYLFYFVVAGTGRLACNTELRSGDACVIPQGVTHTLTKCSPDLCLLQVRLPTD